MPSAAQLVVRTCAFCGVEYCALDGRKRGRTCSDECGHSLAIQNKRAKNKRERQQAKLRRRSAVHNCAHCGAEFTRNGPHDARRKYCRTCSPYNGQPSPDLAASFPSVIAAARRARSESRRRRAHATLARSANGTEGAVIWVAGPCLECGEDFVFNQPAARFCSDTCKVKNHRRDGRARRRARIRGGRVDRRRIFRRDGYRCQLCGRKVRTDVAVPHPRAATIDHVVPLAAGGSHSNANAQTACFECNTSKSSGCGPRGDQLRLIG